MPGLCLVLVKERYDMRMHGYGLGIPKCLQSRLDNLGSSIVLLVSHRQFLIYTLDGINISMNLELVKFFPSFGDTFIPILFGTFILVLCFPPFYIVYC